MSLTLLALALGLGDPVRAAEPCFACHAAPGLAERIEGGRRTTIATEETLIKGTAHAGLACVECHPQAGTVPHPPEMKPVECRSCHEDVRAHVLANHGEPTGERRRLPACTDCHGYHGILPPKDPESPVSHVNVPDLCMRCHGGTLDSPFGYGTSVHGRAHRLDPKSPAAVCTDCHGAHPKRQGEDLLTMATRAHAPGTCGRCHEKAYDDYRNSVHGKASMAGEREAAVCTDCHGEHSILPASDSNASTSAAQVSRTCAGCHADATVIRIRGLPADRVTSYEASYHGAANRWGDVAVANCTSCHGHHAILPADDPMSTINPANIADTCGGCHPGSELKYTLGDVHFGSGSTSATVVKWVRLIYLAMIAGMLGTLGGYIVLDLLAYARCRRRGDLKRFEEELATLPRPPASALVRMTLGERVQHWILLASFIILALTGFPLMSPESGFARVVVGLCGGPEGRAIVHRIAGAALLLTGVYHLGYLALTRRGRRWLWDMLPRRRDVTNVWEAIRYFLGLSNQPPRFGRFGLAEKSEYVGVVWGTFVMGLTGALLAYENLSLRYLPKWAWDGAQAIHGWEAILAVATIALWHMYHVVWKPGVWPMSRAWLTGEITFHQLVEEHPLHYAEIMEDAGDAESQDSPPTE